MQTSFNRQFFTNTVWYGTSIHSIKKSFSFHKQHFNWHELHVCINVQSQNVCVLISHYNVLKMDGGNFHVSK